MTRSRPKYPRWLAYKLIHWLVVKDYPQGGFDLMLMDRQMLKYMAGSGKNTNPNMYAFWLGFRPVILPYHRRAREHGKSRWTFRKKLSFMLDTISGFSVAPIRMISGLGMVIALLSFGYGLNLVIQAALGRTTVQGLPHHSGADRVLFRADLVHAWHYRRICLANIR